MSGTRFFALLVGVLAAVVLAGCTGGAATPRADHSTRKSPEVAWFEPCPATGEVSAAPGRTSGSPMPELLVQCFEGGRRYDLAAPAGVPTVVNVWASWCAPCRKELPVFQRLSDRAGGRLRVLGVVSSDERDAALALAKDLGIRFPTLYDGRAALTKALGRTALPVTLFVNPAGRLVHVYNGEALTEDALAALVAEHLGVR